MKVATTAEMRAIDAEAIEAYHLPGVVLMENAGMAVARCVAALLGNAGGKRVAVFAGKGNNGGDGFVAARHLYNQGARVKVFIIGATKAEIAGDAGINLKVIEAMGIEIQEVRDERSWDITEVAARFADCVIDALLGTGFYGELKPEMLRAVTTINLAGKPVVAVDIPSGVEADTGQVRTAAVNATKTVTFGLPKPGLLLYPGAQHAGETEIVDIGLPVRLLENPAIKQNVITAQHIKTILPPRRPDSHKGDAGRVLVVAGSRGLTGAAALTSLAALRAGAGLVTLGVAAALHDIMEAKLTEVMTRPLPGSAAGYIGVDAVETVVALAAQTGVLAIGPGLGASEETKQAVREIISRAEAPLVIDADALNALAGHTDMLLKAQSLAVLTPHPGEMARLIGLTPAQVNADRLSVARQAAGQWGSIVVLKGAPTVVAFPDGEVYINTSGNAGMATGGTGDVLTGVIAAFIAQGLSSHDAAVAGVYVHGKAGDLAASCGKTGLIASDIVEKLPAAILRVQA